MNLQLIKEEIDNGGKFIGNYEDVNRLVKYIGDINIPYNFIHTELIEIFKINNDYICIKEGIKRKEDK
ncbi:hypothetical protein P5E90_12460 [Clostridium perfringens]|nr:hypothetical protein [Clostridium perfringens]